MDSLKASIDHGHSEGNGNSAARPSHIETNSGKVLRCVRLVLATLFSLYAFIEVNVLTLPPYQQRAMFLLLPLALCFLTRSEASAAPRLRKWRVLRNYGFALLSVVTCLYIVAEYQGLILRMGAPTSLDLVMGAIGTILVLEATRRATGSALPVIAAVFILYAYVGQHLPTSLGGHAGYDLGRIITQSYLTMEGVFGLPLQVMFAYVFPFILFGVALEAVGGLGFAIHLGQVFFGRFKGGPAKVAVAASGVVGMINGSAVANVVTAGSLTIPMMKKIGFQPHVAGAVEAIASTGGQLMPPVMGAAAFMMAEFLGIPYLTIAKAALIPALLFYVGLFAAIHFYSVRHQIGGLSRPAARERASAIFKNPELYLFVLPLASLIIWLFQGYSITRSVSSALLTVFITSLFAKGRRLTPSRLLSVLERAGHSAVPLTAASACVGIVIGITVMTALGSRFTAIVLELSAGNIYAALVLVMFSSIILGMGLPTTICYVLLATLAAPALVSLGIQPLAAHMFILYFGMMSMVTPPTALAAYAGAAIAGSDMLKTGFTAWTFSLSGYLLPFMFVLDPAFLLIGSTLEITGAVITGTLGVIALGAAVAGQIRMRLKFWERTVLLLAAVTLIHPGLITDLLGLSAILPGVFRHYSPSGVRPAEPAKSGSRV